MLKPTYLVRVNTNPSIVIVPYFRGTYAECLTIVEYATPTISDGDTYHLLTCFGTYDLARSILDKILGDEDPLRAVLGSEWGYIGHSGLKEYLHRIAGRLEDNDAPGYEEQKGVQLHGIGALIALLDGPHLCDIPDATEDFLKTFFEAGEGDYSTMEPGVRQILETKRLIAPLDQPAVLDGAHS
jgi:hypothetical protein